MSVRLRFRDALRSALPVWLLDRPDLEVGYIIEWALTAILDDAQDFIMQGVQAAWPGVGTPTALPYIGRTRGITRGIGETDAHYEARLRAWIEAHANARTIQLAVELHEYLPGNPRVRVIARGKPALSILPHWVSVDTDGSVAIDDAAWNWDSVSNPERAAWWSDLWIIVYPSPYTFRAGTLGGLPLADDGVGIGLNIPHAVADGVRSILAEWKGAHSRIRAVLFCTDATAYVPGGGGIMPDGNWGQWSDPTSDPRVASDRDLTVTRYLEPSRSVEP